MISIGTPGVKPVPLRRMGAPKPKPDTLVQRIAARGPVAVLIAGIVLNVGWVALLGWASARTVRWLFA